MITLDRTFGAYLALFGFILVIVGIGVAWASMGSTQQYSLDSSNSLSNSAVTLFLGGMVAVFGAALLLVGLLSATRRPRYPNYY